MEQQTATVAPQAQAAPAKSGKRRVIIRTVGLREIGEAARRWQTSQPEGSAVVISAEKSVQYETVVKAMDALQRAGVQRVGLSVKQGG